MKLSTFNINLVGVLVIGFTFYSAIFLVSGFQAKRVNQFVAYAQPEVAKEATTTEAVNQIEEVRQQLAEIQGGIKGLQDQMTKGQSFPWRDLIIYSILGGSALIFLWQVWVARKTRQQEVFISLVSELNKMKVYPKGLPSDRRQKMNLIVQLHNYLDGVRDIIIREGNIHEGKIKKLRREEDYQMRLLMWYKNLQIYYIDLDPKVDDLPSHWETKLQKARSDPHINPNSLICMGHIPSEWFHYVSEPERRVLQEKVNKMREHKEQRE